MKKILCEKEIRELIEKIWEQHSDGTEMNYQDFDEAIFDLLRRIEY